MANRSCLMDLPKRLGSSEFAKYDVDRASPCKDRRIQRQTAAALRSSRRQGERVRLSNMTNVLQRVLMVAATDSLQTKFPEHRCAWWVSAI